MIFAHCEKCHELFFNTPGEARVCVCGQWCKTKFAKRIHVRRGDHEDTYETEGRLNVEFERKT